MAEQRKRPKTAREVALQVLVRVEQEHAYSNLQLNRELQEANLSRADGALATELVYGTIQRQRTLDDKLQQLVTKGFSKLTPWVLVLLRLSAYQMLYLDRIPPHAIVNEAVTIAKKRGHAGISGMVNGVLRNMERQKEALQRPTSTGRTETERIGINHSYPNWFVDRLIERYGAQTAEQICVAGNEPPHTSIRVNRLKTTRDEMVQRLQTNGMNATPSPLASDGIVVRNGGNMALTAEFEQGLWSIQDESSMLVAAVCAPRAGQRVLDCCAAPGGKTTHLAEIMTDRGVVMANDVHEHKQSLIARQADRLQLQAVQPVVGDAATLTERYDSQSFDVVLLDAPCSGLGVIRRKPEMKWTKSEEQIATLARLQSELMDEAAQLVNVGGTFVYSTCTIAPEENEAQVRNFLLRHPDFKLDSNWPADIVAPLREASVIDDSFDGYVQLLPHHFGTDGFFIAKMIRQ